MNDSGSQLSMTLTSGYNTCACKITKVSDKTKNKNTIVSHYSLKISLRFTHFHTPMHRTLSNMCVEKSSHRVTSFRCCASGRWRHPSAVPTCAKDRSSRCAPARGNAHKYSMRRACAEGRDKQPIRSQKHLVLE